MMLRSSTNYTAVHIICTIIITVGNVYDASKRDADPNTVMAYLVLIHGRGWQCISHDVLRPRSFSEIEMTVYCTQTTTCKSSWAIVLWCTGLVVQVTSTFAEGDMPREKCAELS